MSDLQLALLGIGALFIGSVFAYNKVQERRFLARRERERAGAAFEEVASGQSRGEPAFVPREPPPGPVEHHMDPPPAAPAAAEEAPDDGSLDRRVDYAATLRFAAGHLGEEILRRSAEMVRPGRQVRWEGRPPGGAPWEPLAPSAAYADARALLQLLDRRGVATEDELVEFCHGIQTLGITLVAEVEFPPRGEALKAAQELDAALAELDIQVVLNVVKIGGAPMSGLALQEFAEQTGAALESGGRFCLRDPGGAEVFALSNLEPRPFQAGEIGALSTRGVTVALDVPRAVDGEEAFERFVSFARELARRLEGDLVDDNRRPISNGALEAIAREVKDVRSRLAALRVPAGSPLALRIFS